MVYGLFFRECLTGVEKQKVISMEQGSDSIIYKGKRLRQCTYTELKKLAEKLKIDFNRLPKLNEGTLIKAIKEHYQDAAKERYRLFEVEEVLTANDENIVPYYMLRDVSKTFIVCYSFHFKVPKEDVMAKLKISSKSYQDKIWHYESGSNEKQRIIEYLNSRKSN